MKYILILFTVTSLFVACGGGGEKPQTLEEKKTKLNELRT